MSNMTCSPEWAAQTQGQFITLKFQRLQTECAYDHVFVYDGNSVNSRMIGSFSGRVLPAPVTAKSGSVSFEISHQFYTEFIPMEI